MEKVKKRTNQKERAIMLVGRMGIKELPPFPSQLHLLQVQRQFSMDKRSDLSSVSITRHRRGCFRGKDCLYLHQNDPVTKKPLPADPADVQRLNGKPQIVPKASAVLTEPPPSAQSSTAPISTPSATPKPVVSMIRVDRRDLEPEAEPSARHRVARWRMTEGATVSNHPMGRVSEPKGGISATPLLGGLHAGKTHFGSNQSSMWCRCHLCGISTPTDIPGCMLHCLL